MWETGWTSAEPASLRGTLRSRKLVFLGAGGRNGEFAEWWNIFAFYDGLRGVAGAASDGSPDSKISLTRAVRIEREARPD